jgi:predicted membrane chloride channel (bestrophin family)
MLLLGGRQNPTQESYMEHKGIWGPIVFKELKLTLLKTSNGLMVNENLTVP